MTETFTFTETLNVEECCICHITFAITQQFMKKKRDDHNAFYCPEGHRQYYLGETKEEKLQKRLTAAQEAADRLMSGWTKEEQAHETTRRQRSAIKGHLTRTKNRIGNGVCPCCNRTFKNLARHMQGQHPAYSGGQRRKAE